MTDATFLAKPEYGSIDVGSLVWYYRTNVIVGPLLVIDKRYGGYGFNKKKYWILFDSSTNEYHQAESKWLRVPREAQCN